MNKKEKIALIGYFDENVIFVNTDDECSVPHVHIEDGSDIDTCVRLETNEYCNEHSYLLYLMPPKMCKMFNDFMHQPCPSPKYRNNYEFAVEMWNMNNPQSYVQIKEDENGNIIMPNYSKIN